MQPGRINQYINIVQSWQGKVVTGSLVQTELHTQPHNCFGTLQSNIQWTAVIQLSLFSTDTIPTPSTPCIPTSLVNISVLPLCRIL